MFRLIPAAARRISQCSTAPRAFSTVGTAFTAGDAAELSGYNKIDFCINEDATVLEAVKTFVAHNIGCLVTMNSYGKNLIRIHPSSSLGISSVDATIYYVCSCLLQITFPLKYYRQVDRNNQRT